MIVVCETCGKEFNKKKCLVEKSKRHYCSFECRKTGKTKKCECCGKEFYAHQPSESRKKEQCFCSSKCARNSSKIFRVCECCGKEFHRTGVGKYCSKKCSGKKRTFRKKTKCLICGNETFNNIACSIKCIHQYQSKNKIMIKCKTCGKEFFLSKSRANNRKYCSITCRNSDKDWIKNACLLGNLVQQNKKGLNRLETRGSEILNELGIEHQKQILIENKFLVDVFIPIYKLVIQWDGDYWHGYKKCINEVEPRIKKRMLYDKYQDSSMKKCGYKIIRFWEHDFFKNKKDVCDIILKTIKEITYIQHENIRANPQN